MAEKEFFLKLQKAVEECQNDDNRSQEKLFEITNKLREAYKDKEGYWKLKSRTTWLKEEDNNSKFFHTQTKKNGHEIELLAFIMQQECGLVQRQR